MIVSITVLLNNGIYMAWFHEYNLCVHSRRGKFGNGDGELNWPTSVSVDSIDNVVHVTEYYNNRVSVFTCEGEFLMSFGKQGFLQGRFNKLEGIVMTRME